MKSLAAIFLLLPLMAHGGKVLFWMPFVSKSITITYMPMAERLAERGHEITIVTAFPSKTKSDKIVQFHSGDTVKTFINKASESALSQTSSPPFFSLLDMACDVNDIGLGLPEMKKLYDTNAQFDVVLVSVLFCNEPGFYLAHKFNASLALYSTTQVAWSFMDWAMGQPHNPAYLPLSLFSYKPGEMTLLQRTLNTVGTVAVHMLRDFYMLPKVDAMLDKHFPGEPRPSMLDLERNASVGLQFGHPLLVDGWRPTAPNYINIGMMNCRPPVPFDPKDRVGEFLNNAEHGVVYVSFGSVLQGSKMSQAHKKIFLNVFEKLKPVKVLWKWETEQLDDKPDNVLLSKWLPQQDVLGHPNVKLFVSHGGQSSFQETLCHQTPVLVVSVVGDQVPNGYESEQLGIGLHLPFLKVTEEALYNSINTILTDKTFSDNIQSTGSALMDQIDKPLDRAVWWLEHIMRHPSKYAGRSPVHKLYWFQYFLLDVMLVIVLSLLAIATLLHYIVMWTCCRRRKKTKRE